MLSCKGILALKSVAVLWPQSAFFSGLLRRHHVRHEGWAGASGEVPPEDRRYHPAPSHHISDVDSVVVLRFINLIRRKRTFRPPVSGRQLALYRCSLAGRHGVYRAGMRLERRRNTWRRRDR